MSYGQKLALVAVFIFTVSLVLALIGSPWWIAPIVCGATAGVVFSRHHNKE